MLASVSADASGLIRNVALAGLVMAVVDYAMQRRRIGKQTRMSKEEVKQEHKQTEGDPEVKSAIRSRQLAAARNRMMADIPTADVVLVNPTHVAVALRYEPERARPGSSPVAPAVVAAAIRERAGESRVPLVARRTPRPGAVLLDERGPGDPPGALRRGRPGARVRHQPAQPRRRRRRAPQPPRRDRAPARAGHRATAAQSLRTGRSRPIRTPTPGRSRVGARDGARSSDPEG